MNQYHIRIDGEQSTDSYTYQELVDMGLFELDADSLNGIEVKKITKPNFTPLKSYCFPERQCSRINNNGAYIDEFGQIVRPNIPNGTSSTSSASSSSSTSSSSTSTGSSASSSSSSTSSTSNSDDWDLFWRIIGTILVLAIGIPILINVGLEGFWSYVVCVVGYFILRAIWDKF